MATTPNPAARVLDDAVKRVNKPPVNLQTQQMAATLNTPTTTNVAGTTTPVRTLSAGFPQQNAFPNGVKPGGPTPSVMTQMITETLNKRIAAKGSPLVAARTEAIKTASMPYDVSKFPNQENLPLSTMMGIETQQRNALMNRALGIAQMQGTYGTSAERQLDLMAKVQNEQLQAQREAEQAKRDEQAAELALQREMGAIQRDEAAARLAAIREQGAIQRDNANYKLNKSKTLMDLLQYGKTMDDEGNLVDMPMATIPSQDQPTAPRYKVNVNPDGSIKVDAQERVQAGECGHFVNDYLGTRVIADSYESKKALIQPEIMYPLPGMVFVSPAQGKSAPYGHTGIIEKVNPDGTVDVVESNYKYSQAVGRRKNVPIASFDGFFTPPMTDFVEKGAEQKKTPRNMTDDEIMAVLAQAGQEYGTEDKWKDAVKAARYSNVLPEQQEVAEADSVLLSVPKELRTSVTQKANQFDAEPTVKNFQVIQEGKSFVDSLPSDTKSPSDDQAFIYSFAKIMDPNSVVREGEYATVQKYAQSWAESFGFNSARIFTNTKFLTKEAIDNMKKTISSRYKASEESYNNVREQYIKAIDSIAGKPIGEEILQNYKLSGTIEQENDPLGLGLGMVSDSLGLGL